MSRRDSVGLIIVSIVAVVLIIGLLFKACDILSNDFVDKRNHIDSTDVKAFYEEIEEGPASVILEEVKPQRSIEQDTVQERIDSVKLIVRNISKDKITSAYKDKVYIIVTGAFASKSNAESWKEKLRAKSYKADIYFQSDRGLYLVYVNKFDSESKASSYSHNLKAKGIDNHIKPIK